MGSNYSGKKLARSSELNRLFSELGDESTLTKIRRYLNYHLDSLATQPKIELQSIAEKKLYNYIYDLEPDVFFDKYFSEYFGIVRPFSHLSSFFSGYDFSELNSRSRLLKLFYLFCYLRERFPNECLFFQYDKLQSLSKNAITPSFSIFCCIWRDFFVMSSISVIFPDLDYSEINYALSRLNINTSYYKALMIMYIVLYRDYKNCEHKQKTVEKLRDTYDPVEKFKSPQAVFTYKNFDESKPRFLNKLFENTVPISFRNSDQGGWKSDFSTVLNSFCNCSLDYLIYYFIPDVFSSISTVISYLCSFPSSRNHSSDRKVIEIICAYLYAIESAEPNKVNEFQGYLEKKLNRESLINHKEIFNNLSLLQSSYAVINHIDERNYQAVYGKVKTLVLHTSKPKNDDKSLLDFYMDGFNNVVSNTYYFSNIPALNFLIEFHNNCRDSKVEDCIIFDEIANNAMLSNICKVVLLQPSFSFLHKWLSDYRTKNIETIVVIYEESIVNCLKAKLDDNNLISKKLYYTNQETNYKLAFINTIDGISEFDLALSFYNKDNPKYEDLVSLSKLVNDRNELLCVVPHKFFETEEYNDFRHEMASLVSIRKVTYFPSILFGYNPKKKYLVEFRKKNEGYKKISLRFFEIDKRIHADKSNRVKSVSDLFFINAPTEKEIKRDAPYDGETIDFFDACYNRELSKNKKNYNRAQQVGLAPDFNIYFNATNHGNGRQAKCFFAKYLPPSKKNSGKKDYGAKIEGSRVTISAKDNHDLAQKIIGEFPFSEKFTEFRSEAEKEIKLALKEGRLTNISLFTFCFSFANEIKQSAKGFDYKFCYNALCRTSLGSLILNEATLEDFESAIAELVASTKMDAEKLYRQLEITLNCANKKSILLDDKSKIFTFIETRKELYQTRAHLREALSKKTLSFEEEKRLIDWLMERISKKPAYLGTMIKLFTGMSNPEVSMLSWADFCSTDYCDYYHFNVSKQRNYKSKEPEDFLNSFKYRVVPIPTFLSELIIAQREKIQKKYKIPFEDLMKLPLIADSNERFMDFCSPNKLRLNSNKALTEGAMIPQSLVSYPENDGVEEHDLSKYSGDFYASNFKYHALNDAMMTQGEVAYVLGLVPHDTFSKHYCDYTNPFLQMKLVEKLNDWGSLYSDWKGAPQVQSGSTKSDIKGRKVIIPSYNSGCASGQLQLFVKEKCSSSIEITVAGSRGIVGTATVYEENKNEKKVL